MSQISNRPVDWETLVKENEDRLYRAALAILCLLYTSDAADEL